MSTSSTSFSSSSQSSSCSGGPFFNSSVPSLPISTQTAQQIIGAPFSTLNQSTSIDPDDIFHFPESENFVAPKSILNNFLEYDAGRFSIPKPRKRKQAPNASNDTLPLPIPKKIKEADERPSITSSTVSRCPPTPVRFTKQNAKPSPFKKALNESTFNATLSSGDSTCFKLGKQLGKGQYADYFDVFEVEFLSSKQPNRPCVAKRFKEHVANNVSGAKSAAKTLKENYQKAENLNPGFYAEIYNINSFENEGILLQEKVELFDIFWDHTTETNNLSEDNQKALSKLRTMFDFALRSKLPIDLKPQNLGYRRAANSELELVNFDPNQNWSAECFADLAAPCIRSFTQFKVGNEMLTNNAIREFLDPNNHIQI